MELKNESKIFVFVNGTLLINDASIGDLGVYRCQAVNLFGSVSANAEVQFYGELIFFFKNNQILNHFANYPFFSEKSTCRNCII